jgi:hypothetical protein
MTKFFAVTNLVTITPLTGCETADTAVDMLSGMFPNAFSLIAKKETLIALAENINIALETDEINAVPVLGLDNH